MNNIAQLKDQLHNIIDEYFPEIDDAEIIHKAEFFEIKVTRKEWQINSLYDYFYGYTVIDTSDLLAAQNVLEFVKPLLADAYLQTFD